MPSEEEFQAAADQLSDALVALERMDYNVPVESDLQTILAARDDLSEVCQRLRADQQASRRRNEADGEGEGQP